MTSFSNIVFGVILDLSQYCFMVVWLTINMIRVPLIITLAMKKNPFNIVRSKTERQKWEEEYALQERRERLEAKSAQGNEDQILCKNLDHK